MQTLSNDDSASKGKLWTSWALSIIAILFLIFDGTIHIMVITPVVESSAQLGYPIDAMPAIGIIELVCLVLFLIPRTSIFGAILLTGYLGGAIATQVRVHAPLFSTVLFPIYLSLLIWGGLYLRSAPLRALIPIRRSSANS